MSAGRTPLHAPSYALAQPAPTVYEHRVTVGGTAAQYVDAGTGSPLLVLHGHEQSAASSDLIRRCRAPGRD